jgi:DNA-binding GntR family transcriptional regulator
MRYRCNMAAADTAYAFAKERILDGRLPGGELISEGEIAAGVGLSRTPVREAFLRLESEGLLRLYPKRGALVVPVSAAEVRHVMETRLLVERFCVERALPASAALQTALGESLLEQDRLVVERRAAAFVEADREFHRLFVAAADNPILLALHDSLRDRQSRMGLAAIARDGARARSIVAEHRDLVAAVLDDDAARALDVLTHHLQTQLALLQGALS